MSRLTDALRNIEEAQRQSRSERVLFLEGPSDVPILCALLGNAAPARVKIPVVDDVALFGLTGKGGSGREAVEYHVTAATSRGIPHVHGIVDGDGVSLDRCRSEFDPPFAGPLFRWPAYSIEGMLAHGAPPPAPGIDSDAALLAAIERYLPTAALNRLTTRIRDSLSRNGLSGFFTPALDSRLLTEEQLKQRAGAVAGELADIESLLDDELRLVREWHSAGLDAALAAVNGKWLVAHLAGGGTALDDWCNVVRVNGVQPVRLWWQRCVAPPS
ncbi:MAG: hypothetical protein AB7S36_11860 [Planctomycetota bacterium]